MSALLVLRPEPGASATAARIAALGLEAIVAPLFRVAACAWDAPDPARFDALLFTSANAARLGGAALAGYAHLPAYAVGSATAAAVRAAGFTAVRTGTGDVADALALAAGDGVAGLLHLAGREHRAPGADIAIERRIVYAAAPVAALPAAARDALAAGAIVLLHSPRAAQQFRALIAVAGLAPATIAVAAISANALAAAGDGWRAAAVAAQPNDDALLAVAVRMCDQARLSVPGT